MKMPLAFVDLNFERWAEPTHELVVARKGGRMRHYHPTRQSLIRVANLCRNKLVGRTYPFASGWIFVPDDYWEEK